MRRVKVIFLICCAVGAVASIAPSAASAAFTQCPPVDKDTSCQFLFTVTDTESTVQSDPTQGPFEGIEDALIGIQNSSSKPLSSIPISAEENLFGFENDGICSPGENPIPAGCVILTKTSSNGTPVHPVGEKCPEPFLTTECGFPEAEGGGEPKGVTFPEGVSINGFGKNGNPVTGYEGPTSWYTSIGAFGPFPFGSGVVNFSPAIPPGGSSYFSLESPPVGGFGSPSSLTTTLSGGGQTGPSISVLQGTPVTDSATLGGANAAAATGSVSFAVYADAACKQLVGQAGTAKLAGGGAGPSTAQNLAPGKYYWQASYGGSLQAQPAASTCGSEVLTVLAPTSTSTLQSTAKAIAASLTVPLGTPAKDQAFIAGALAKTSTGSVSYVLYKDSKCTVPALAGSAAAVVGGVAGPSAAVTPKVGTYYWRASYSGDGANAPSASTCGSEVLVVALKANLGLSGKKGCVSKRRFPIHPHGPRGIKLVSFQEFINGALVKAGRLSKRQTSVNLIGLPKGTYEVELVSSSSSGKTYEDTRTFHTCVPKKHKKGKKGKKGK
jgi:hypothetical protein